MRPTLSVVATVYNDENIVQPLVDDIVLYVSTLDVPFEIILVNDNSPDNSEKAIETAAMKNPAVKGISLSRNFGQQIAMSAGIRHASGEYIAIMDGDLQNPPSLIPVLYNKLREGFDIIYCTSKVRNNFVSAVTSRLFWFIINTLFKVRIIKNQLMMKIMTRKFVDDYNQYNEHTRTVAGIILDMGSKYDVIQIENKKRHSGKSNYNFFKRFNLMVDMIISLSSAPLNIMIHLGWIIFVSTCCASVYYLVQYFFYDIAPGFTSIILSLFFFGSLIILMLGFIGRYVGNIYLEVKNRPLYHVKKTYNL